MLFVLLFCYKCTRRKYEITSHVQTLRCRSKDSAPHESRCLVRGSDVIRAGGASERLPRARVKLLETSFFPIQNSARFTRKMKGDGGRTERITVLLTDSSPSCFRRRRRRRTAGSHILWPARGRERHSRSSRQRIVADASRGRRRNGLDHYRAAAKAVRRRSSFVSENINDK